ncbi:hypothetical protein AB0958_18865 [Streptomyces sp. NPDC006655]|uniref:hypothetical protein n=1 Tax=Streptomyces sp. NPDC006655 TaxID=3156898 RepID=UPI003451AA87
MSREPGPDERRVRYLLARLGARPLGHSHDRTSTMTDQPIIPTRIIPSGAPLPARAPQRGEIPPWRTAVAPPPPAPPAPPPPPVVPPVPDPVPVPPDPQPLVVRHVHEMVLPEPERGPRLWERLWDAIVTWRLLIAVLAALFPWAYGRSPVGIWAHTLHQARTEAGVLPAYTIAGVALTAAWAINRRNDRVVPRFLFVTALIGAFGVFEWFDAITLITGVHR